jgi:hypothetical protein
MKLPHRRQLLHLAAGAAALPTVPRIAWAFTEHALAWLPRSKLAYVVADAMH